MMLAMQMKTASNILETNKEQIGLSKQGAVVLGDRFTSPRLGG